MNNLPVTRIRKVGNNPANPGGEYVLYWMIANRRVNHNFSLDRAIELAKQFDKPLIVFEALRCDYRWNSDRIHWFVIQGMFDNQRQLEDSPITYYPYLEANRGAGKQLLKTLAQKACAVISDDFPCFFLPRMIEAASKVIPVLFELIDSNGLYPMRDTERVFSRAHDFRRHLQKNLLPHLAEIPSANPLARLRLPVGKVPVTITRRWPAAELKQIEAEGIASLARFPIDHSVPVSTTLVGGTNSAKRSLKNFLKNKLARYADERNQPEQNVGSGFSPFLHFGHLSAHEIFESVTKSDGWNPGKVFGKATGSKGWWGASENAESFLDELITWREIGFNMCANRDDYDQFESLPEWARISLEKHESDLRPVVYTLEQFEQASTHDPLWNAAQNQLRQQGIIHNYLRMLWGKKILHWSKSPRQAIEIMIELNNKYALDGRNPNSYSGIFWCLGRYDRAWGPEREVFGKIRYMASNNTARKLKVKEYVKRYNQASI